jgi:hypothetical protein
METGEMLMKRLSWCWLVLLTLPVIAQTGTCPVEITRFEIHGGFGERSHYALVRFKNNGSLPVEAIEYQFDTYDNARRLFLARYYLDAGKVPGGLGKPIAPGKERALQGMVDRRIGFLYGNWMSEGGDIKINVIHFTDGSKWERKGWREEPNPN